MKGYIEKRKTIGLVSDEWFGIETCKVDEIISFIKNIPTAEVEEVKHGVWIKQDCGEYKPMYRCSVCGRLLMGYSDPQNAPYCHCGAKMDGKEMKERFQGEVHNE